MPDPELAAEPRDTAPALQKPGLPGTLSRSVSEIAMEMDLGLLKQESAEQDWDPGLGSLMSLE